MRVSTMMEVRCRSFSPKRCLFMKSFLLEIHPKR
jgi:hypothetical protein